MKSWDATNLSTNNTNMYVKLLRVSSVDLLYCSVRMYV